MAVLSSQAHEWTSSRPNLLAVSLPSPAFILLLSAPNQNRHATQARILPETMKHRLKLKFEEIR